MLGITVGVRARATAYGRRWLVRRLCQTRRRRWGKPLEKREIPARNSAGTNDTRHGRPRRETGRAVQPDSRRPLDGGQPGPGLVQRGAPCFRRPCAHTVETDIADAATRFSFSPKVRVFGTCPAKAFATRFHFTGEGVQPGNDDRHAHVHIALTASLAGRSSVGGMHDRVGRRAFY